MSEKSSCYAPVTHNGLVDSSAHSSNWVPQVPQSVDFSQHCNLVQQSQYNVNHGNAIHFTEPSTLTNVIPICMCGSTHCEDNSKPSQNVQGATFTPNSNFLPDFNSYVDERTSILRCICSCHPQNISTADSGQSVTFNLPPNTSNATVSSTSNVIGNVRIQDQCTSSQNIVFPSKSFPYALGTQHPNKRSSMMFIHEQRSQISY